jgi:hypothetical protein
VPPTSNEATDVPMLDGDDPSVKQQMVTINGDDPRFKQRMVPIDRKDLIGRTFLKNLASFLCLFC